MFERYEGVAGRLGTLWFGEYVKLGLLERGVKVDEAGLYKRTVLMMKR